MNARVERVTHEVEAASRDEVIPGVSRAKVFFILAAAVSFVLSVSLWFTGSREQGIFVGIWVPSILSAGTLLLGGNHHE